MRQRLTGAIRSLAPAARAQKGYQQMCGYCLQMALYYSTATGHKRGPEECRIWYDMSSLFAPGCRGGYGVSSPGGPPADDLENCASAAQHLAGPPAA